MSVQRMVGLCTLVLSTLLWASQPVDAQQRQRAQRPAGDPIAEVRPTHTPIDNGFLREAAYANRLEIETARLAQQRASSPAVRRVADHILKDHTAAQDSLRQLAQAKGVNLPQDIKPQHRGILTRQRQASGTAFDRLFIADQVRLHNDAIALFQGQMDRGHDSEIRNYAAEWLPGLQDHLKQARNIHSIQTATQQQQRRAAPARRGR